MQRFPLPAKVMTMITAASFSLAACTAETAEPVDETETAMEAQDDGALTGAEIEEAVPGIEEASPEGDTANTANLEEDSNVEYSDDPNSERVTEPSSN